MASAVLYPLLSHQGNSIWDHQRWADLQKGRFAKVEGEVLNGRELLLSFSTWEILPLLEHMPCVALFHSISRKF